MQSPDMPDTLVAPLTLSRLVLVGGTGSLFGLALATGQNGVWLDDDADNTLRLLH